MAATAHETMNGVVNIFQVIILPAAAIGVGGVGKRAIFRLRGDQLIYQRLEAAAVNKTSFPLLDGYSRSTIGDQPLIGRVGLTNPIRVGRSHGAIK